jgi:hypothetical protein
MAGRCLSGIDHSEPAGGIAANIVRLAAAINKGASEMVISLQTADCRLRLSVERHRSV